MKLPYRSLNSQFQALFGERVHKIPLDAGLLCPNKTGEISLKGCIFCDPHGSGYLAHRGLSITEQISSFRAHRKEKKFLGYFQANCNTHAEVDVLDRLYAECLTCPDICGLIVSTRPDCLAAKVLSLLEGYAQKTFLMVELGLQSIHEQSLAWLNRNHTYEQFESALLELKRRRIRVVVHLIVGLPGEGFADIRATVMKMNALMPWGIKFHLLHVLEGTALCEQYRKGGLKLMGREEYIETIIELLEWLNPFIGVHRLSADRDARLFVAPQWAQQKTTLINDIHLRMVRQKKWQGRKLGYPADACREPQPPGEKAGLCPKPVY